MSRQADPEEPRGYLRSPLLGVGACFALGVAASGREPSALQGVALLLASAGASLLLGLVALKAGWFRASLLLALAGFAAAGAMAARLFEFRFPPSHVRHLTALGVDLEDPVRFEGEIIRTPFRTPYGLQLDVELTSLESRGQARLATGKVRLRLAPSDDPETSALTDSLRLQNGDFIRALARLHRPRSHQNPGSFDFRRWMESIEDLYWVGTIKSPLLIEKVRSAAPGRPSILIEKTRQRLLRGIDSLYPPWSAEGHDGSVLKAVLLGDRSSLDSDTIENFRKTGLYHLLVIAGLHVGLLAMLAGLFLRLLRLRPSTRTVLVFVFLLGYASLVEQRAPTLRATLMIGTLLMARFFYRQRAALNSIGLAGLILLVHRPPWLFESGFQLSFSAALLIAGLAVPILELATEPYRSALGQVHDVERDSNLTPRLAQFRLDLRSLIRGLATRFSFLAKHSRLRTGLVTGPVRVVLWAGNIVLFSAVLQLGLLLPMAETFHRVTFAGIGLNALAIPIMTLLLAFAVPTVVLSSLLPTLAVWPGKALALVMSGLFLLTDLPLLPAWLSYRVPDPPRWVAWGFALSIVILAWALTERGRLFGCALAAFGVFAALISLDPFLPRIPSGVLEVTSLDCGGGDAVFVVLPDRTTLLWGAGGSRGRSVPGSFGNREGAFRARRWEPGENIVSPYLWSRGISKVDILVPSSSHEKELSDLAAVIRNFRVGEFWHGAARGTAAYEVFLEQARHRGVQAREVAAAERIPRGTTSIQIIWPPAGPSTSSLSWRDHSMVMRLTDGAASVLLSGDISGKVEQGPASAELTLESQVLAATLHGTRSIPTQFLAQVSPRVALLNVGSGNPMSLPTLETLEHLRAAGARIFRTDLDGAVTVELRGPSLVVRRYRTSPAE